MKLAQKSCEEFDELWEKIEGYGFYLFLAYNFRLKRFDWLKPKPIDNILNDRESFRLNSDVRVR